MSSNFQTYYQGGDTYRGSETEQRDLWIDQQDSQDGNVRSNKVEKGRVGVLKRGKLLYEATSPRARAIMGKRKDRQSEIVLDSVRVEWAQHSERALYEDNLSEYSSTPETSEADLHWMDGRTASNAASCARCGEPSSHVDMEADVCVPCLIDSYESRELDQEVGTATASKPGRRQAEREQAWKCAARFHPSCWASHEDAQHIRVIVQEERYTFLWDGLDHRMRMDQGAALLHKLLLESIPF